MAVLALEVMAIVLIGSFLWRMSAAAMAQRNPELGGAMAAIL